MRAGRKRKPGPRYPSGKRTPAAVAEDAMAIVLAQPHRMGSKDQRCESLVGRMAMAGLITEAQYEAAEHYRRTKQALERLWAGPVRAVPPLVRMVAADPSAQPPPDAVFVTQIEAEEERSRRVLAAWDRLTRALAGARPAERAALDAMVMRDVQPRGQRDAVCLLLAMVAFDRGVAA